MHPTTKIIGTAPTSAASPGLCIDSSAIPPAKHASPPAADAIQPHAQHGGLFGFAVGAPGKDEDEDDQRPQRPCRDRGSTG